MARCGQVSSTPLFRSAARGSDRTTITSASALPTYRRAGQVALLQLDLCRCATLVTVQLDMVPLSTTKSLRIVKRSLPNGHTHQTYDWGRSNAKFRMQNGARCCLDKGSVLPYFWPWSPLGDAIRKQRPRIAGCWCITAESRVSLARVPLKISCELVHRADRREVPWMAGFAARTGARTSPYRAAGPHVGVCKAACTHVHHRPS